MTGKRFGANLRGDEFAERPRPKEPASGAKFDIAETLNAEPDKSAEHDRNDAGGLVREHGLKEREGGGQGPGCIEKEDGATAGQTPFEQTVVDMATISTEYGLPAKESAGNGESDVEKRDGKKP